MTIAFNHWLSNHSKRLPPTSDFVFVVRPQSRMSHLSFCLKPPIFEKQTLYFALAVIADALFGEKRLSVGVQMQTSDKPFPLICSVLDGCEVQE